MTSFLTNRWIHFALLAAVLAGAVYFSGSQHDLRERLQYATFDTFNRLHPRPPTDKVAIIDVDEASLKILGQWPWPRTVLAEIVRALDEMGARVVAFDVVFAEADRTSPARIAGDLPPDERYDAVRREMEKLPDNDAVFARAIGEAGNVVTGFTRARPEDTRHLPYQKFPITFLTKDKAPFYEDTYAVDGVAANLEAFSSAAAGNGSFMATPDIDGIIRKVSLFVRFPPNRGYGFAPNLYPMLGMEALRVSEDPKARYVVTSQKDRGALDYDYLVKIAGLSVPIESDAKMWVYYRDIKPEEYVSARLLFDPLAREEIAEKVKDKIVFIGTSVEGLRDIRSTPLDIFVPGVEVHVNVVEQILQGKYLKRPDIVTGAEAMIIAAAGLVILLLAPFINLIALGVFTATMMALMFYGSWLAYQAGLLIDPVYPSAALSVLFLGSALLAYLRSEAERRQVRQAFGLYIAPSFMEELTKNPDKLKLGGEVRELTVLFSDIRSFTSISESLSPEALTQLMNDFLTPMSDLVMNNRGTIDKYMGDAMMAFWNAPLDDSDHARHACLAALKMNEALAPVNEKIRARAEAEGRAPILLNAGLGLNTGPCSVGNMGSKQRFAYSALGDTVNLASRLEGQTKYYGVDILVGEETQKKVPEMALVELDLIKVKGKDRPVRIFTLLGDEAVAQAKDFRDWQTAHNAMLAAYRIGDFGCAAQDIVAARAASGGRLEAYYGLMGKRIADMAITPPDDWDGVYEAKEK